MQIDPKSYSSKLVAMERQNMDKMLKTQQETLSAQQSALKSLDDKFSAFQKTLKDLNKASELQAQKATLSQEGVMTVTSDGKAISGQYSFFVEQVAQAHQLGVELGDESTPLPRQGVVTLKVKDKEMKIDLATLPAGATAKDLVVQLNEAKDNPGIKAALVRSDGKLNLVLTSKESGLENRIQVDYQHDGSDGASATLAAALAAGRDITKAQDAIVTLGADNPIRIVSASNKIENAVDGLTLQLNKKQKPEDGRLLVTVGQDNEKVNGALKKFVEQYNGLVDELSTMTRSDPKNAGAFASDSGIRSLKSLLGNAVRDLPNGLSLASLGIKTDKQGKLSFSESDFNKLLEKDPEILGKALMGDDGLLQRMSKTLDPFTAREGMLKGRKDSMEITQKRITERKEALDKRMEMTYQRYLKQFTLMNQMQQTMQGM